MLCCKFIHVINRAPRLPSSGNLLTIWTRVLLNLLQETPKDNSIFNHPSTWKGSTFVFMEIKDLDILHDDVIKWKHFPRYWPFARGIHWSPVNSPHKDQWHGALMFSLIYAWKNGWINNRDAGDLRCHCTHYDVTVMYTANNMTADDVVSYGARASAVMVVIWFAKNIPASAPERLINSLWPNDTIWQHRSGSTLFLVMACCLTAPSHYLNQCWLIISEVQRHSY